MDIITEAYDRILAEDCIPLTLGGDHTIAYPILRAIAKKHGPVGLIHVDAHADINEHMFGEPIAHGTPFRRAVEAGRARHEALHPDRPARLGLCRRRFRLAAPARLSRRAGGGVLVRSR